MAAGRADVEDGAHALAHAVLLRDADERLEVCVDVVLVLRAGAVDEYVDAFKRRQRRLVADVQLKMGVAFVRDGRRLPVDAGHAVTFVQKAPRDGAADAAGRAGDQCVHLPSLPVDSRYSRPTPRAFHRLTAR